jgi:hypothetical protein
MVQQFHKLAQTTMPAEMLQRYNAEIVAVSRAELALRESALAAAKTEKSELERLREDDALTGNRDACTILMYVHKLTTAHQYEKQNKITHFCKTMTDEQRQALDDAIQRVPLWSVLGAYKRQYKKTTKVYAKHNTSLPVGMWPQQKAPGARPKHKPAAKTSNSHKASYHDVVSRLERQAVAHQDLNALRDELSEAQISQQKAADAVQEQVAKRKHQHNQGRAYHNHIYKQILSVCVH